METIAWWVGVLLSALIGTFDFIGQTWGTVAWAATILLLTGASEWKRHGWAHVKANALKTVAEGALIAGAAFVVVCLFRVPLAAYSEYRSVNSKLADELGKQGPLGEYGAERARLSGERDVEKSKANTLGQEKTALESLLRDREGLLLKCNTDLADAGLARPIEVRPTVITPEGSTPTVRSYRKELWEDRGHAGLLPTLVCMVPDRPLAGSFHYQMEADNEITDAVAEVVGAQWGSHTGPAVRGKVIEGEIYSPNVTPNQPLCVVLYGKQRIANVATKWRQ